MPPTLLVSVYMTNTRQKAVVYTLTHFVGIDPPLFQKKLSAAIKHEKTANEVNKLGSASVVTSTNQRRPLQIVQWV